MARAFRSLRLLPVLLAASTLVLTTKLFDVASDVERFVASPLAVGTAHAETAKPDHPPAHSAPPETKSGQPETKAHAAVPIEHPSPAGKTDDTASADGKPAGGSPPAERPAADQPPLPSPQELQVLQSLAQRREALDQRAQDVDRRADLLQAAEARLDRKLAELKDMQATLLSLIKTHDEQQEEKTRSLVKIYENMKPKDASRIFEELDMDTLLPVVERMNERKLAPILASMNPTKAKTITEELARLRQLASQTGAAKSG